MEVISHGLLRFPHNLSWVEGMLHLLIFPLISTTDD